jgi:zinc/manganese transport system substrate-binding protein
VRRNTIRHILVIAILLPMVTTGCGNGQGSSAAGIKTIAVTYSIMGSLVKELAGDSFHVVSIIPNGLDPHEWEPSARDMEEIMHADLIVENGLGLEGGLQKALERAREAGIKFFTIADHIAIRTVGPGEGIPGDDPDQALGASDPHLWMDPVTVETALQALTVDIKNAFGVDLSRNMAALAAKLTALDRSIRSEVDTIPKADRKLVTGHESLGYFAARYGFKLVGAVIPSLTSQAEVSAADMAALKKQIEANHVKVVFTELGTSPKVVEALARETGAKAVPLADHYLPPDLSYFTMMEDLSRTIVESLR